MAVSKAISVTEPIAVPSGRRKLEDVVAWLLISVLLGVTAGALLYGVVQKGNEATRVAQIQSTRAAATVWAYEQAWASLQPAETRVRVSGTGPGLAWVAEQQVDWAENAVTGTGPGLVALAEMQAGYGATSEPTGTGPGLTHLRERFGPEVAVIGTP